MFFRLVTVFYFLAKLISIGLSLLLYAMMARALLPFFIDVEDSKFFLFIMVITEPFVVPFRLLLAKFNLWQDLPIDMSFTFAYIVYALANMILPVI